MGGLDRAPEVPGRGDPELDGSRPGTARAPALEVAGRGDGGGDHEPAAVRAPRHPALAQGDGVAHVLHELRVGRLGEEVDAR